MNILEAAAARHSVRSYTDKKIEGGIADKLREVINECNRESGLNIQLFLNEPRAFDSLLAKYGKFKNVNNYIALIGKKDKSLDEKCGYYGEKIVLQAQILGLNTCWVAATYSKRKSPVKTDKGEKLLMVIALGYGATQGTVHKLKPVTAHCADIEKMPEWFKKGLDCARLAPTAMNQQKYRFELINDKYVRAFSGTGFYAKTDLGIAKYHFETGTAEGGWEWYREE